MKDLPLTSDFLLKSNKGELLIPFKILNLPVSQGAKILAALMYRNMNVDSSFTLHDSKVKELLHINDGELRRYQKELMGLFYTFFNNKILINDNFYHLLDGVKVSYSMFDLFDGSSVRYCPNSTALNKLLILTLLIEEPRTCDFEYNNIWCKCGMNLKQFTKTKDYLASIGLINVTYIDMTLNVNKLNNLLKTL